MMAAVLAPLLKAAWMRLMPSHAHRLLLQLRRLVQHPDVHYHGVRLRPAAKRGCHHYVNMLVVHSRASTLLCWAPPCSQGGSLNPACII